MTTRCTLLVSVLLCFSAGEAAAFEQPPIQSPHGKACRNEAAEKVLVAPDPNNLGVYAIGKQIYLACMARSDAAMTAPVKAARKSRRAA